jgi:hypothetical protein
MARDRPAIVAGEVPEGIDGDAVPVGEAAQRDAPSGGLVGDNALDL